MKQAGRSGFSLVELMITVSIIAILAAIGTPALLQSIPGMRVSGAARQMLSDLRLARTLTVEKGDPVVLKLHVDATGGAATGHYVLAYDVNLDNDFSAADGTPIKEVSLVDMYPGIAFQSNDHLAAPADGVDLDVGVANTVTFRTNGSASEAGYVYLMPSRDAGTRDDRNRRVRLMAATGNLRIQHYQGAGSWQ
jgi:prepilin-type N-terminal cleavage/methylation domain-containing protein